VLEDCRFSSQGEDASDSDTGEEFPKDFQIKVFLFLVLYIEIDVIEIIIKNIKCSHPVSTSGWQVWRS
jgi:hypothetical protein